MKDNTFIRSFKLVPEVHRPFYFASMIAMVGTGIRMIGPQLISRGIDNGVMHMMSLAEIPMIVLFGPTNSEKFAPKNNYTKPVTFDQWADSVLEAYDDRAKVGKTKLALLNFWYDALKYHDKDPEFWTDMLYFGLKIITKGQFGPHAKIS